MKIRRIAASLLAVGLLTGLTACGDNASSASEGTATQQSSANLTKDNFAQTIRDAQSQAGSAHIEASIESQGQNLKMTGDIANLDDPAAPEVDMKADMSGQSFEMIVVDKALYITGDGLTGSSAKKWLKIDLSDKTNPLGQLFESANPGNFTSYLEGVTKFDDKGETTVDGVSVHHYSVTVDTKQMLAKNPMFKGQDASALGIPGSLTSELYVDSENRPVEIKVELGAAGAFDAHFSDYGKDVSIQAPPASEVGDFSLGH